MKRYGLLLAVAGLLSAGCGGAPVENAEDTTGANEQQLWMCGGDPAIACPEGWACDAIPPAIGSCRLKPVD